MTIAFDGITKACLVAAFVLLLPITALTIAQLGFGYHSYAELDADMQPTIPAGSLIVSHPVNSSNLAVGDVIAFHPPQMPSELVTRRISKISFSDTGPEVIFTRADAASHDDDWAIPGHVQVDQQVLSVPLVGYPAAALQTQTGRFLFLVLPGTLFALLLMTELARRVRRRLVPEPA